MSVTLLVLQAVGITMVFTHGTIFNPLRMHGPWWSRELAACPLCCGVWIGGFVALLWMPHMAPIMDEKWSFTRGLRATFYILGIGCLTAAGALTLKRIWSAFESISAAADAAAGFLRAKAAREADKEKLR